MPVRSPLLRQSRLIFFPPGTEMFQFPGFAIPRLYIQRGSIRAPQDQSPFADSPEIFAGFHALHRLLVPRHPPCALSSLTTMILSSHTERQESWCYHCRSDKRLACRHGNDKRDACRYGNDPLASLRAMWRSHKTLDVSTSLTSKSWLTTRTTTELSKSD